VSRSIPPRVELVRLRTTITYALEVICDVEIYAEQAADVVRRIDPDYATGLDRLRDELKDAQLNGCIGSPAAILLRLGELLGGA
jgi:hypothetical protein